jgi:transcriptional regulator with XRE-family HTH domain
MTIVGMPGKERVASDPERTAFQKLRVVTNEAARLIRDQTPPGWAFLVPSNFRAYGARPVPHVVATDDLMVMRQLELRRLIVRDFNRSPRDRLPRQFTVLETSAFRRQSQEVRLRTGMVRGSDDAFFHARGPDNVRFWIDIVNELGDDLRGRLTSAQYHRLFELGDRASVATAASVRARREALEMTRREFGNLARIFVDDVLAIETGAMTVTTPLLDAIEAAFATRKKSMNLFDPETTEIEPESSPSATTGAEVRARREELGITQERFARFAGFSANHLSMVETGRKRISAKTQAQIDAAFTRINASRSRALS